MDNKIPAIVITAFIAVVVLAGVLMPVLEDARTNIGDPITYTNTKLSNNNLNYDYGDSVIIRTVVDDSGAKVYVNDKEITRTSDYQLLFLSDALSAQIGSSSAGNLIVYSFFNESWAEFQVINVSASSAGNTTMVYSNGVCTLTTVDGAEHVATPTWAIYPQEGGSFIAHNASIQSVYTLGKNTDFVIYSSNYTTGELDTAYSYSKGVAYCQEGYTMTVEYNPILVDGTTDIYTNGNATVTISNGEISETFTPYRCLIPEKVTGHESNGASYNILGIIPVLIIVAVLLAIVAVIFRMRE